MNGTRSRSPVVLLALVACVCSATARGIATVPPPARQPSVTTDVVYGHKDGLALTLDVHRSARPNGAGLSCRLIVGELSESPETVAAGSNAFARPKSSTLTVP